MVEKPSTPDVRLSAIPERFLNKLKERNYLGRLLQEQALLARIEALDPEKPVVYPAGPLGFAASTLPFLEQYRKVLVDNGVSESNTLDPWQLTSADEITSITQLSDFESQKKAWQTLNERIGLRNEIALIVSDFVTANLDGLDIDSGTSSEIGFAAALKIPVFAYRTDFREAGDNPGSRVNLQVERFIISSGGVFATSYEEHQDQVRSFVTKWK